MYKDQLGIDVKHSPFVVAYILALTNKRYDRLRKVFVV